MNFNINVVDSEMLPGLKKVINKLNEGKPHIAALKKQHISLLETEDEVTSQMELVIRNRESKLNKNTEVSSIAI